MQCNMELNEDKTQWHVSIHLLFHMRLWGKTCCSLHPPLASERGRFGLRQFAAASTRYSCPFTIKAA